MNDSNLRRTVVEMLRARSAHAAPEQALADLKPQNRNQRPAPDIHSVFEELEHIRIAQHDILEYTLDPSWVSPAWPDGYWPVSGTKLTEKKWEATVAGFTRDLERLLEMAEDPSIDLTAEIPHGEGRTYLRQLLLAADHNSYHFGQIIQTRKLLGDWK